MFGMSALLQAPGRPARTTTRRRRPRTGLALVVCVLSLVVAAMLGFHFLVPDIAGFGLLVESALPWLGLIVPVLVVAAFVSRSRGAILATVVPVVVWAVMFVPAIVPLAWTAPPASGSTLTVASQNVEAGSGTAGESARALADTGAQVIALQEMDDAGREEVAGVLGEAYPYTYGIGTVGVWSAYPIENAQALDLGLGWQRGIAADLATPSGLVSICVVHAASARPGDHAARDEMLANLADYPPRDENSRLLLMGDFNAASTDRSMAGLFDSLDEANQSGGGLGFTWPAAFPATRLDHVLQRGMEVVSHTTLRVGASDHLAVLTTLNL